MNQHSKAVIHYAGLALLMAVGGIVFLTWIALTYEGNDIAQAGILVGLLGSVATGILGFMSGMVLGRHFQADLPDTKGGPVDGGIGPGF